jgi:hypothetical protein
MEYKLLKTIQSAQGGLLVPKETMPRLTAYPANNCVNPGLGQIARLYSFYVPLYSRSNLHTISKIEPNVDALLQEGKGDESEQKIAESVNDVLDTDDNNLNPIEYNDRKRKLMGDAVQESFLHPKLIKTDKIVFSKAKPQSKTQPVKSSIFLNTNQLPPKQIKHKFQFE